MSDVLNGAQGAPTQPYIIKQEAKQSNGLGVAGFVLALLGLILSWLPVVGWILSPLGFILSLVGVFKKPKGLAIAGLIISLVALIIVIIIAVSISKAARVFNGHLPGLPF
jgi:hypothetical protein